ncbi:MAG: ThiF family adenylyltransferase [Bacteroidales bacterium]|nr:ThiF family adenylyltransferase [Bacteroidales bacterium]
MILESSDINASIVDFLKKHEYEVTYDENHIVTTHAFKDMIFKIEGMVVNSFPYELPRFWLLERSKFKHLAHVGWDNETDKGIICEGVSINRHLDYTNPEIVYLKALESAEKTIFSGLSNKIINEAEIIEEFTAHWRFSSHEGKSVLSFVEPQSMIIELQSISKNQSNWAAILNQPNCKSINQKYVFRNRIQEKSQIEAKAFYIPIIDRILPPGPTTSIIDWWKSLLNKLPTEQAKELKDIARRNCAKKLWILGSVILNDGKHGWFCISFSSPSKQKLPFYSSCEFSNWEAKAYNVELHNKVHLKPRGGATLSKPQTIAIVGCGSVGAEIARQLVCSGVENIELVDYDKLKTENIYRHYLSSEYIGVSKSDALAHELSYKYPYTNIVKSKFSKLIDCLNSSFLKRIDGVIVATGSPTDERYFNEILVKMSARPWVIYVWVEGHGFGGHAVYVHNSGKGCLNCLYRDSDGNKSLESIQNFLKAEQNIAIDLSGCGSHFLPYSFADAIQSALLATRLATQAINGEMYKSCRISWKASFSTKSPLETTYRYKNYNSSLEPEDLLWEDCDVCQ